MTITPSFQLRQSPTHIILEIAVPHIRMAVEEIQVTLSDENRMLHWYGPPIYLLVLNFAPNQFRALDEEDEETTTITSTIDDVKNSGLITEVTDESETTTPSRIHNEEEEENAENNDHHRNRRAWCATYLPHIQNGMVRIELEKLIPNQHWDNLDLLGKLKQPKPLPLASSLSSSSSVNHSSSNTTTMQQARNWLHEIVHSETVTTATIEPDDAAAPFDANDNIIADDDTAATALVLFLSELIQLLVTSKREMVLHQQQTNMCVRQ
jgi:hypothetical protein